MRYKSYSKILIKANKGELDHILLSNELHDYFFESLKIIFSGREIMDNRVYQHTFIPEFIIRGEEININVFIKLSKKNLRKYIIEKNKILSKLSKNLIILVEEEVITENHDLNKIPGNFIICTGKCLELFKNEIKGNLFGKILEISKGVLIDEDVKYLDNQIYELITYFFTEYLKSHEIIKADEIVKERIKTMFDKINLKISRQSKTKFYTYLMKQLRKLAENATIEERPLELDLKMEDKFKILVYLYDYIKYFDDDVCFPFEMCIDGIANKLNKKREAVSRLLKKLTNPPLEYVYSKLKHVEGISRRRKVYFLTDSGRIEAAKHYKWIKKEIEKKEEKYKDMGADEVSPINRSPKEKRYKFNIPELDSIPSRNIRMKENISKLLNVEEVKILPEGRIISVGKNNIEQGLSRWLIYGIDNISYWYFFIPNLEKTYYNKIIKEILYWSEIYHKNNSRLKFLSPRVSEEEYIFFMRIFNVNDVPALIITDDPNNPTNYIEITSHFFSKSRNLGKKFEKLINIMDFVHNYLLVKGDINAFKKEILKNKIEKILSKHWNVIKEYFRINIARKKIEK